jgi:hypothetical protein
MAQPPSPTSDSPSHTFYATYHPLLSHVSTDDSDLDDMYAFDPATMTWTNLSVADNAGRPSARHDHGFTSAGGLLYVYGGYGRSGESVEGVPPVELRKGKKDEIIIN